MSDVTITTETLTIPTTNTPVVWHQWTGVDPFASLVWIHGLGEHMHRYSSHFRKLASDGVNCYGFDQRGFGRTAKLQENGVLGHAEGWGNVMGDISWAISEAKRRSGVTRGDGEGLPIVLGGQSMGALRVLCFVKEFPEEAKETLVGVIATSPAIKPHPTFAPGLVRTLILRGVAFMLPTFSIYNPVAGDQLQDPDALSHDSQCKDAYTADELVHPYVSLETGRDLIDKGSSLLVDGTGDGVGRGFPKGVLPMLVMHGGMDRVTDVEATREFVSKLRDGSGKQQQQQQPQQQSGLQYIEYESMRHELHNEPQVKTAVLAAWLKFIQDQCKP